jgi:di/tricarboxylate transporter
MDVAALIILVIVFLLASVRSVNMGALALVAAFVVSLVVYRLPLDSDTEDTALDVVLGGFPAELFVILVGVTYLFAIARNNGTVDWLVHAAVRSVGGRTALIPWAMFVVAALITSIGAVTPAATAIIAPIALTFAKQYRINPALMGLMVIQGATGGSFSPLGVFGIITNGVLENADYASAPATLFLLSLLACALVCLVGTLTLGRRAAGAGDGEEERVLAGAGTGASLRERDGGTGSGVVEARGGPGARGGGSSRLGGGDGGAEGADEAPRLDAQRSLTLLFLVLLAAGALIFKLNIGFLALAAAVLLTLFFPRSAKGAVDKVAWGTVLLITGIVTYVQLLDSQGTIDVLGEGVAGIGAPLFAALLICLIGAAVSAFASTTGILGTLIPLSLPFLATGEVSVIGLVVALAISSSVVDCSPFSTNGALVVANSAAEDRDRTFRTLMVWGMSLIVVAPLLTWALLVLPGWL